MLQSLVNGILISPLKGLKGTCQFCGDIMIAKCGDSKRHHWAHKMRDCDEWQSGKETEWHINWKKQIGLDFAEKRVTKNDQFHIADILIPDVEGKIDLIIEFQNSPLSQSEVYEREFFYGDRLIWVLNGTELREKFIINRNANPSIYKKWLFEPKLDYNLSNEKTGEVGRGYVIQIPRYSYSKDYETFLFSEGYTRISDSLKVVEMRKALGLKDKGNASTIYYFKAISDDSLDIYLEYRDKFINRRNSLSSIMIKMQQSKTLDTDIIKDINYLWKYARRDFNISKQPIYIDLNDAHIFQVENGNVAKGFKGKLIKKALFIDRIMLRVKNSQLSLKK